ncbi:MAG: hypothetical protein ACLFU9_02105 [Candidatus Bathyarchaeia archaeon]
MPKKKKKSWKERQREKQVKQQRAQEAYQRQLQAKRKAKKWPKGKILVGLSFVTLILISYTAWQYYVQLPPAIGGETGNSPPPTGLAPSFSFSDINGTRFSLSQFNGKVVAVHFMAVGCSGQIYSINDIQLKQLRAVCGDHCSSNPVTMFTVAVATCPNSDLVGIRSTYGITWVFGNDYADGKLDIVEAYKSYSIKDGTILLIDKTFNVNKVYNEATTAEALSSKINQLLGA